MYSYFVYYSNMNEDKFKPRTFAETLTLLCKARGGKLLKKTGEINQSEIARIAGINQPNVSRWFKEGFTPHQDSINILAKAFKITPAQMRGESPINAIDGYSARTAEDDLLLKEILSLPEDAKNLIRQQVMLYRKLNEKS